VSALPAEIGPADPEFAVPPELEASAPPEAFGRSRDDVWLLAGHRASGSVEHHDFARLPDLLRPGDVLVVNTSATVPAAVDAGNVVVHFSTGLADGNWLVELRRPLPGGATAPYDRGHAGDRLLLRGGATVRLLAAHSPGRLWRAAVHTGGEPDPLSYLRRYGRPIRYRYVDQDWPLATYQTVFAREPGSAEMPSAGRPFTADLVTRLVTAGVVVAPLVLHTGVGSPEAHEPPYPEWHAVPPTTARLASQARAAGGRVIAVGTTVVRALESAADETGTVHAASGWTDLVVTPARGVRVVDGLLTGFHEPRASHLLMLEAIAGPSLLRACYLEALEHGYLWHEFGDLNLLLP
jgi:S-adenosylmethionine:tRNA ribosyltransferase-isomerase